MKRYQGEHIYVETSIQIIAMRWSSQEIVYTI